MLERSHIVQGISYNVHLIFQSFRLKHFLMTPDEATAEVCTVNSWLGILKEKKEAPLLDHPDRHVLATHYFVSVYWTIIAAFRLGYYEKSEVDIFYFAC